MLLENIKKSILLLFVFLSFVPLNIAPGEKIVASGRGDAAEDKLGVALEEHVKLLSNLGSRVVGYEGNRKAADYIYDFFSKIGLDNVTRDSFHATVPIDKGAEIRTDAGDVYDLHCVWPNMVRTSTVPPEGISGELLFAGQGDYSDYSGHDLENKVVVLEFNSGKNWIKAAELGARAIIFIEPENTGRKQAELKFVEVPLNIPRFMMSREDHDSLQADSPHVTVTGRMDWEKAESWNVFGAVKGTNPELSDDVIVFSAYYDSMSVVPAVAPGADSASGIAGLLETARYFQNNPPERTVMFLATSGHFTGLQGIDDFIQKRARHHRVFQDAMESPFKEPDMVRADDSSQIDLFVGLELSSNHHELGIFHLGDFFNYEEDRENRYRRVLRHYGDAFLGYAERAAEALGRGDIDRFLINGITPRAGMDWRSFLPAPLAKEAEVVLSAGNPAISLTTINTFRNRVDTPVDTFEHFNAGNLAFQMRLIKPVLHQASSDPDLPKRGDEIVDQLRTLSGRLVIFDPRVSFVPDAPVENAVAFIRNRRHKTITGVRSSFYGMTDSNGEFRYSPSRGGSRQVEGYKMDQETGDIYVAPDRGVAGAQDYPMSIDLNYAFLEDLTVLFECVPTDILSLVDPMYLRQLDRLHIFDEGDGRPTKFGYSVSKVNPLNYKSDVEPYGVVFSEPGQLFKVGLASDILGYRFLHLNSSHAENQAAAEGKGYDPAVTRILSFPHYRKARDMFYLNEFRMREYLQRYGIRNERLDMLHRLAESSIQEAREAMEAQDWERHTQYAMRAAAIESRAYPEVGKTINDVIIGVIFYMFLLIPFAYFMERLLFGFVDFPKQIAGTAGIFLATYLIMRWVHPAFRIADAPEIILLGFIILTLAVIVITVINTKFQDQIEVGKQKKQKVYETDVGRMGASFAAFRLGVNNMKKRKIRTTLTSVTLVLLTFTVLSFTSISAYLRFTQVRRPNVPNYEGALIRDRIWRPIENPAYEQIKLEFSEVGIIAPRAWLLNRERNRTLNLSLTTENEDTERVYAFSALGLSHKETEVMRPQQFLIAGEWFAPGEKNVCILPDYMAALLGLTEDDVGEKSVIVFGKPHLLKGIFDAGELRQHVDLDNAPLTPADFTDLPGHIEQEQTIDDVDVRTGLETFTHQDVENVIILPYERVREVGGTLQSLAVHFHEGEDVRGHIENFVSRLAITVFAGIDDRVTVYSSADRTAFAGLGGLFIPILIAASIILNTMLGSVYERFNEIGIFSSVGLAPIHIGALFIAEASVYAVLGGVSGYLIGQVIARLLMEFGVLAGLTLNYSSLAAVFSTMLVMAVVLLSTIYPAKKAAQMAVPDVTRKWHMPEPDGDDWEFEFPFTISGIEALGLFFFLSEYFDSFGEDSVGDFYTQGTKLSALDKGELDGYLISFRCWIAPFDLSVSEDIHMMLIPSEDNIYEIHVKIRRISGEPGNWKRLNRRFMNVIRKQFLIWRTVEPEVKEEYAQKGISYFEEDNNTEEKS